MRNNLERENSLVQPEHVPFNLPCGVYGEDYKVFQHQIARPRVIPFLAISCLNQALYKCQQESVGCIWRQSEAEFITLKWWFFISTSSYPIHVLLRLKIDLHIRQCSIVVRIWPLEVDFFTVNPEYAAY